MLYIGIGLMTAILITVIEVRDDDGMIMETMVLTVPILAVIFIVIKLRETFRRNNVRCKIIICENCKLLHHIISLLNESLY